MGSNTSAIADRESVLAVFAEWERAQAALAEVSLAALSPQDVLALLDRRETVARRDATITHGCCLR